MQILVRHLTPNVTLYIEYDLYVMYIALLFLYKVFRMSERNFFEKENFARKKKKFNNVTVIRTYRNLRTIITLPFY